MIGDNVFPAPEPRENLQAGISRLAPDAIRYEDASRSRDSQSEASVGDKHRAILDTASNHDEDSLSSRSGHLSPIQETFVTEEARSNTHTSAYTAEISAVHDFDFGFDTVDAQSLETDTDEASDIDDSPIRGRSADTRNQRQSLTMSDSASECDRNSMHNSLDESTLTLPSSPLREDDDQVIVLDHKQAVDFSRIVTRTPTKFTSLSELRCHVRQVSSNSGGTISRDVSIEDLSISYPSRTRNLFEVPESSKWSSTNKARILLNEGYNPNHIDLRHQLQPRANRMSFDHPLLISSDAKIPTGGHTAAFKKTSGFPTIQETEPRSTSPNQTIEDIPDHGSTSDVKHDRQVLRDNPSYRQRKAWPSTTSRVAGIEDGRFASSLTNTTVHYHAVEALSTAQELSDARDAQEPAGLISAFVFKSSPDKSSPDNDHLKAVEHSSARHGFVSNEIQSAQETKVDDSLAVLRDSSVAESLLDAYIDAEIDGLSVNDTEPAQAVTISSPMTSVSALAAPLTREHDLSQSAWPASVVSQQAHLSGEAVQSETYDCISSLPLQPRWRTSVLENQPLRLVPRKATVHIVRQGNELDTLVALDKSRRGTPALEIDETPSNYQTANRTFLEIPVTPDESEAGLVKSTTSEVQNVYDHKTLDHSDRPFHHAVSLEPTLKGAYKSSRPLYKRSVKKEIISHPTLVHSTAARITTISLTQAQAVRPRPPDLFESRIIHNSKSTKVYGLAGHDKSRLPPEVSFGPGLTDLCGAANLDKSHIPLDRLQGHSASDQEESYLDNQPVATGESETWTPRAGSPALSSRSPVPASIDFANDRSAVERSEQSLGASFCAQRAPHDIAMDARMPHIGYAQASPYRPLTPALAETYPLQGTTSLSQCSPSIQRNPDWLRYPVPSFVREGQMF